MRFVLLREAGGIGDVVRTLPVARGLKERYPLARVDYVSLAAYEGLVRLSPDVDAVHAVSERERRSRDERPDPARHAYLRRFGRDARFIDLYCPAYRHEVETDGAVTLDRVALFCRAAGVEPSTPRITVPGRTNPGALTRPTDPRASSPRLRRGAATCPEQKAPGGQLTARSRSSGRAPTCAGKDMQDRQDNQRPKPSCPSRASLLNVVGLAPYATHAARSWLGRARLVALAGLLRTATIHTNRDTQDRQDGQRREASCPSCKSLLKLEHNRLVFFHSWKGPRPGRDEGSARDIGGYPALRLPWPRLAATVAECDLVISVDTGILHLAGALGVPALGLFGSTSGEILCRPYPTHTWITARLSARELPPGCRPPCYCRRSRGYSPGICGRVGCTILNRLDATRIIDRTLALLPALARPLRRAPPWPH